MEGGDFPFECGSITARAPKRFSYAAGYWENWCKCYVSVIAMNVIFQISEYSKIGNIKDIPEKQLRVLEGSDNAMRMFLSRDQIKVPSFTSMWLVYSYVFLVVVEFLDGLTTNIGLNLGLTEVGMYAKGVLGSYGFWGLMAWKYSIVAAVGALIFLFYYGVKKYAPTRLKLVGIILTVGFVIAGMVAVQVVVSNIHQIELALYTF
jgi:hypothetical protein